MSKSKAALLAAYGMLAATAQQEQKDFLEFTNPYAGLPELRYSGSKSIGKCVESCLECAGNQQKRA